MKRHSPPFALNAARYRWGHGKLFAPSDLDARIEGALVDSLRHALDLPLVKNAICVSDLDLLRWQSDHHRITPYVAECLEEIGCLPAGVRESWQKAKDLAISHYHWRKAQWGDVLALLRSAGRAFIPLKGAATAFRFHRRPYRVMHDFDILVHADDVPAFQRTLEKAGLEPAIPPAAARFAWRRLLQRAQFRNRGVATHFVSEGRWAYQGDELAVDLHWRPSYRLEDFSVEIVPEALWQDARKVSGNEWELSLPHQFLLVLVHAISSGQLLNWLDTLLLYRALGDSGALESWLMKTPAIRATLSCRALIHSRLESISRAVLLASATERAGWPWRVRPVTAPTFRDPDFSRYWGQTRLELAGLTKRQRLVYFLGFFVPSLEYYEGMDLPKALLSFYGSLGKSLCHMARRCWRGITG